LPLGERASVHADLETMVEAIVAPAVEGDQLLVMSNGGFGGSTPDCCNASATAAGARHDRPPARVPLIARLAQGRDAARASRRTRTSGVRCQRCLLRRALLPRSRWRTQETPPANCPDRLLEVSTQPARGARRLPRRAAESGDRSGTRPGAHVGRNRFLQQRRDRFPPEFLAELRALETPVTRPERYFLLAATGTLIDYRTMVAKYTGARQHVIVR
jgi:hypothetical protein